MCPGWLRKEKKKKPIHSGNPIISSVSPPPLMSQAPAIFHVTYPSLPSCFCPRLSPNFHPFTPQLSQ